MAQEVGIALVLEQIRDRLNSIENRLDRLESRLDTKADRWEIRILFTTVIALLGVIIARL